VDPRKSLGSLNRAIELVKQQLAAIDVFAANKQQALTTLMNLQNVGITEKEIVELVDIVDRWNKQYPGLYHQGNGGSGNGDLDDGLVGH
jgi:hypothetical protein